MTIANLIEKLQACVDDPMWANHAEVNKATLAEAIKALATGQMISEAWLAGEEIEGHVLNLAARMMAQDQTIMSKQREVYLGTTIRFERGDLVKHAEHGLGTVHDDRLYAFGYYDVAFDHGIVRGCTREELLLSRGGQ